MRKSLLALSLLAATSAPVMAADYSDGDIHKNDYKWMQFNYMYSIDEMPRVKGADDNAHDYLEMEFGGRSGIFDLYGYVDVFNLATKDNQDKSIENGAPDKMFMKFAPRMSLDAVTGKDLSFGPVQELYIASLMEWGGNNGGVNNQKIGLGSDVMVPWLGKIGLNLYSTYDGNNKGWNGSKSRLTGSNHSTSSTMVHSFLTKVTLITNSVWMMMLVTNLVLPRQTVVQCSTAFTGTQIASRLVTA